ncbi:MAG: thioredoxin family protein [Candidatus Eisenbacteria bacterium]|uniref:Thioredoxin family protein n=1 Tax=Eiseniibacteriota bacterium TaxID=2212470 RepID=A0A849SMY2_UNCEI|nr:thioredoxin family protein [Candidatus Eisenbacteria bacterium]
MKSLIRLAAVAALATLTLTTLASDSSALAIGEVAPQTDVALQNVDGKSLTLANVAGKKGTLVVFTCNACPFAKAWESRVAKLGNQALGQGIGVIAINSNDPSVNAEDSYAQMQSRAKTLGLKFPYVVDAHSNLARAFGATRTPEVFLFDAAGKLVYHGAIDDNSRDAKAVKEPYLRNAVAAVASNKAVTLAETKSIGCSIKFHEKSSD